MKLIIATLIIIVSLASCTAGGTDRTRNIASQKKAKLQRLAYNETTDRFEPAGEFVVIRNVDTMLVIGECVYVDAVPYQIIGD